MKILSEQPGKILVDVNPQSNFWRESGLSALQILESKQGNHIRNMRLLRPGYNETNYSPDQPFNPTFLAKLKSFSPVRFMGWQVTNGLAPYLPDRAWENRRPATYWTQSMLDDESVSTHNLKDPQPSLEYMISLCNILQIEPWFNMPHRYKYGYVRSFARFVKENLDPNLNVWVEYSNEVWNPDYPQNWWTSANMPAEAGGSHQKTVASYHKKVWDDWHAEFGAEKSRVIRVLAGFHANSTYLAEGLSFLSDKGGADVVSVGGYIGANDPAYRASAAQIIERQFKELSGEMGWHLEGWKKNMAVANSYNIPMTCYEGGQHLLGYEAAKTAQRDPRMYDLYVELLTTLDEIGVSTFVHSGLASSINNYGAWGGMESVYQPLSEAHKYRAMLEFVDGECDTFMVASSQALIPSFSSTITSSRFLLAQKAGSRVFTLNGRSAHLSRVTPLTWQMSISPSGGISQQGTRKLQGLTAR
jgi:hypothetical protein